MYANQTDYSKLYGAEYFGKTAGATSFAVDAFTQLLIDFCRKEEIEHVVDVGSGSGVLATVLRQHGLAVQTCDFSPVDSDGIHLDLAGPFEEAQRVAQQIGAWTGGKPWLVTCLDVLEHIDIEQVAPAVRNLRVLCKNLLVASISTRPSSADNRYHATILPKHTWLEILRKTGFAVDDDNLFESARTVRRSFHETDNLLLVSRWAAADPFGDIDRGEPDYVLLSPTDTPGTDHSCIEDIESILDTGYLKLKRAQFGLRQTPRLGLNIHHLQDFILLRPLLDVLPRANVVALLRGSIFPKDELALIRGILARCGVETIDYERCAEIPWSELALKILLSPSESNVALGHILGRQVVEAAKLHSIHTIQLQHGVWVQPFQQRAIEFGSDTILSWGASYANILKSLPVVLAGRRLPAPAARIGQTFHAIGAAKFVDMRLDPPHELLHWRLGVPMDGYRATALLATNLRWNAHGARREDIHERLAQLIRHSPDVFFVVKLHPSERVDDASALRQSNSLVLDDILLGSIGVSINRLIAAVDVVISSLSTLLVDAAVAGKPCIQYQTHNSLAYEDIEAVNIETVGQLLQHISALPVHTSLVSNYAEAAAEPFYRHFSEHLQHSLDPPDATSSAAAASFYSAAVEVEDLFQRHRAAVAELEVARRTHAEELELIRAEHATMLETQMERSRRSEQALAASRAENALLHDGERQLCQQQDLLKRQLAAASTQHAEASTALEAMRDSTSWRVTAPLRAISGRVRDLK